MPRLHPLLLLNGGLLFTALLASCAKPDRWSAFAYPQATDLTDFRYLGDFESLESCRAAVQAWRLEKAEAAKTDYECGKNCEGVPTLGLPVMCETTER